MPLMLVVKVEGQGNNHRKHIANKRKQNDEIDKDNNERMVKGKENNAIKEENNPIQVQIKWE